MPWLDVGGKLIGSIHLLEAGPAEGGTFGTPPFMLRKNTYCSDCKGYHDIELCPDCGAFIYEGFGLEHGPGIGQYQGCEAFCGWKHKECLPHDECCWGTGDGRIDGRKD